MNICQTLSGLWLLCFFVCNLFIKKDWGPLGNIPVSLLTSSALGAIIENIAVVMLIQYNGMSYMHFTIAILHFRSGTW